MFLLHQQVQMILYFYLIIVLLDKEQHDLEVDLIHELVDLKLIHLVRSRVTVSDRPGRIYEAYMLDLSQYAGARKRRKLVLVEFWKADSTQSLRRISLLYTPGKSVEQPAPGDGVPAGPELDNGACQPGSA